MSLRLTMAQALTRYLTQQFILCDGVEVPYFAGVWAIFGHGNVAGLGEALYGVRDTLPTYRAHNEQAMAHAAIAYAKQMRRQRAFACTTSIGPGATNMVTAAALAHVNRLPVLFLPGDVYAGRRPDPVLQQIEDGQDGTVSANDCFRPVSRYFDRITRPEQILSALPRAMATLLDPALCGPVTLALCQDVQAEAYDYPESFFERRVWRMRASPADPAELADLNDALNAAKAPLMIVGGGVKYAGAEQVVADFAAAHGIPFAETQAGKGAIAWDHPQNLGGIGVTGTEPANLAAGHADLIIGVGTRLQDFTTGSAGLFNAGARLFQVNANGHDAGKFGARAVVGDIAKVVPALQVEASFTDWMSRLDEAATVWDRAVDQAFAVAEGSVTEAQVLGGLWRGLSEDAVIVAAAGGLPGELHKLWRTRTSGGYHLEYGYSCMGYEIAGGLGVKMAEPGREVCVVLGDGSYLMMNSEIATSVMLGVKLIIVVMDNRGFGCINRLQQATGGASFNNRLEVSAPDVDFAGHARSLGAVGEKVGSIAEFELTLGRARAADRTSVIVIDTDPDRPTRTGGAWWDVAVPEVSARPEVGAARAAYQQKLQTIQGRKPS